MSAQPDPDVLADALDELAHLAGRLAVGRRDEHVAAREREPVDGDDREVGLGDDVAAEQHRRAAACAPRRCAARGVAASISGSAACSPARRAPRRRSSARSTTDRARPSASPGTPAASPAARAAQGGRAARRRRSRRRPARSRGRRGWACALGREAATPRSARPSATSARTTCELAVDELDGELLARRPGGRASPRRTPRSPSGWPPAARPSPVWRMPAITSPTWSAASSSGRACAVQPPSGGRERHAARRALEQPRADLGLQRGQALGERRLRDAQTHRGAPQAAEVGGHAEAAQLVEVGAGGAWPRTTIVA